jgi:DNA repair protein RadC
MTRRRAKRHRSTRSTRPTCPGDPHTSASTSQPSPTTQIRDLPPDERPRQRLLRSGAHSLSDAEVLSIILGNGCREVCPLDLARQILEEGDGLFGLVGIHAPMLHRKGLGDSKAASVLASLELARRLARAEVPRRRLLRNPVAVASYLALKYTVRDQEVIGALYIDVRNRLVGERELYRGTLERALVEPREIFRDAILRGAAGIVLFHTHPSETRARAGRTSPSPGGWPWRPRRSGSS